MSNMFIINPIDHQSHNIFSKEGKNLLKKYIKMIQYGNAYRITVEKQKEDKQNVIKVFSPRERENYKLSYEGGDLKLGGFAIEAGLFMYVVSPGDKLYLHEQEIGEIHHSSFGFKKVNGAGMMFINGEGKITAIDNLSGHYEPPPGSIENVKTALVMIGYDITDILFGWVNEHNTVISELDTNSILVEPPDGGFAVYSATGEVLLKNEDSTILYNFKQAVEFPITFEKLRDFSEEDTGPFSDEEDTGPFSEEEDTGPFSEEEDTGPLSEDQFPVDQFSGGVP